MPTVIQAIIPNAAIDSLLQQYGGLGPSFAAIDSFKVGEGGFIATSSGNIPRDPTDPGPTNSRGPYLTDLDVIQNSSDYPADAQGSFQKSLVSPGDFNYDSGTMTLEVTCLLDFGEFNDDGNGNSPEIYEIGLFAGTLMVAYGTMTAQTKTVAVQIPNIVRITATGT